MTNRTQTYVASLLSNPDFFNYMGLKKSFYNNPMTLAEAIADVVHKLEVALEGSPLPLSPPAEDASNNLGP
jgi:hypothetical protein